MKVLISPAKSINEAVTFPKTLSFSTPHFHKEAKSLVVKLKKLKAVDLEKLMHVSKDIAELNVNRFKKWHLSETPTDAVKPAGFLFTGEVYKGLAFESFNEDEIKNAQNQLIILSGLYGLLKPLDLIFPYRLEMGTKWAISEDVKSLYQFWGTKLTRKLQSELSKDECVINLASNEYSKAISLKSLKNKVITPVFKEFKNGEYKIVMMYAKHARGAMARYIIQNQLKTTDELKLFQEGGYTFMESLSSDKEYVFVR